MPQIIVVDGLSLSGYTTTPPIIDGIIGAEEWKTAGRATFGPLKTSSGETITGIVYIMNDEENLYMAVSIYGDNEFGSMDGFEAFFDNDYGSKKNFENGDDFVATTGANLFYDGYYYAIGKAINPDTIDEGTNDGKAAGSRQGSINQFELKHPLNSSDSMHDFSLSLGQKVGFLIRVSVDGKWYDLSAWGLGKLDDPPSFASYTTASSNQKIPYELFLALILVPIIAFIIFNFVRSKFKKIL
ncbi:MAG: hypothetical protein QW265_00870 [Candidatus Bathyarchaeia archaeon]